MKPDLEITLRQAAPKLFADCDLSASQSCMGRGFECGDGWFGLLLEAAQALEALNVEGLKAAQVKEKFGTLRFYLHNGTPEARSIVLRAEQRSSVECDVCGAAGTMRSPGGHYMFTACDKHSRTGGN